MALQGALETFQLDEVLRLLGSSEKTGLLTLTGDRGVGRVWVVRGSVTNTEIEVDTNFVEDEADAVFHMLRFEAGDFLFDDGEEGDPADGESGDASLAMDDVLDDAQARLAEWREIVGTISGLESRVTLVSTIDAEVTIEPAAWERLALVGSGISIREMGVQLAEAELHTMRAVKELVERGLVDVGDAPAPLAPELASIEPADEVESVTPLVVEPEPQLAEPVAPVDDGAPAAPPEPVAPVESPAAVEDGGPVVADDPFTPAEHGVSVAGNEPVAPVEHAAFVAGNEPVAPVEQGASPVAPGPVSASDATSPVEAYQPPTDVPESWQTAAPASAWDTPAVASPAPWPSDESETPAPWEPAEAPEWPAAETVAAGSDLPTPPAPQPWPATTDVVDHSPPPAAAPEAWAPPAPVHEPAATTDGWPEPAGDGAEAWNAQPFDGRSDAAAGTGVAHEWDAPAATGIESLYDDDDGFGDGTSIGAIEYQDGAFDQAAEALGWGSDVDGSPEGFWGESAERVTDSTVDTTIDSTEEASEMARRLAELSPAAARAVAQAARATTPEEREAALAAAEAEDASVDRSLLLRFLGSFDG